MTNIITSPETIRDSTISSVFLAGGITNCPDWQKEFIEFYIDISTNIDINIINPRRKTWDDTRNNDDVSKEQIEWEYNYLNSATGIVFWFPKETLCPITLFELGAALHSKNIIAIGIDPDYQRKLDIEVQTNLVNKNIPIVYCIKDLVDETAEYFKNYKSFEKYDEEISEKYEEYHKGKLTRDKVDDIVTEIQMEQYSKLTKDEIIEKAKNLIFSYSQIDGDHHKRWCLDQVIRILTGAGYEKFIYDYCHGEDGEEYEWNVGIAP